jgi:hypothetical protein
MQYRLFEGWKHVCEAIVWHNGTLIDECAAIGVIVICVKNSVPMLYKVIIKLFSNSKGIAPYNRCHHIQRVIGQLILDVN